MKKIIAAALSIFLIQNSFAGEIWVTAPELTSRETLRQIAERPREEFKEVELTSLFEAQLRHPVSAEKLQSLLDRESRAENEALQGRFHQALEYYGKLAADLENIPNVFGLQKMKLTALIRIAEIQSKTGPKESRGLWTKAHAWAPQARLSPSQFSPLVIARFLQAGGVKKRTLEVLVQKEAMVFVDGRRMKFVEDRFVERVEPGSHQVSALIPGAQWQVRMTQVTTDTEATTVSINAAPAVEGDCENPIYAGPGIPSHAKILASFDNGRCERIYDGHRWFSATGLPLAAQITHSEMMEKLAPVERKSWYSKLANSPWFWIGLGVLTVGTATVIRQNQEAPTVIVPTHSAR